MYINMATIADMTENKAIMDLISFDKESFRMPRFESSFNYVTSVIRYAKIMLNYSTAKPSSRSTITSIESASFIYSSKLCSF